MKTILNKIKSVIRSKCIDNCYFVDNVSGRCVKLFERPDKTRFMAESKWDAIFFRVEVPTP